MQLDKIIPILQMRKQVAYPKVIHLVMLRLKFELRFPLTPRERLKGESGVGMEVRGERPKNGRAAGTLGRYARRNF